MLFLMLHMYLNPELLKFTAPYEWLSSCFILFSNTVSPHCFEKKFNLQDFDKCDIQCFINEMLW